MILARTSCSPLTAWANAAWSTNNADNVTETLALLEELLSGPLMDVQAPSGEFSFEQDLVQ